METSARFEGMKTSRVPAFRGSVRRKPPGTLLVLGALLGTLAGAGAASALHPLDLIGRRPKPFVEPEGFYRAVLPAGFDCALKAPRHVECQGQRGAKALLTLQVLDVPASATPELVALNEMKRFRERPHFRELSRDKTRIDGLPAMTVAFSYDHLGNVERAGAVQALYTIREGKLFVVHFECRLDQFAAYAKDLSELYATFKPAALDAGGNPILDDALPPAPAPETPLPGAARSEVDTVDFNALQRKYRGRY